LNLSEAKHLLANQSDVFYLVARAYEALEQSAKARERYLRAARQKGDFQKMAVRNISSMTYWSALAMERLGQVSEAKAIFYSIITYYDQLGQSTPKIDYFATSLPTMLLFNEDLGARNRIESRFLRAQAMTGLGEQDQALTLLHQVLHDDANHIAAQDLLLQLQGGRQELVPH
jgi:tetratricopeptide (TPR) repeat protein